MLACFLFLFYEKIRKNQVEAVIGLHPFFSEMDLFRHSSPAAPAVIAFIISFIEVQRNT